MHFLARQGGCEGFIQTGAFYNLEAPTTPLAPKGETRALQDLLSVSYDIVSILVISRYAAPPYPAAPDFPPSGGQNKLCLK